MYNIGVIMSTCYSVNVELRVKDEAKVIETLRNKIIRAKAKNEDYSIEEVPTTLKELLGIFFVKHQNKYQYSRVGNWHHVNSGFSASHGWKVVMIDMFKEITPYLEDKSELYIDIENDYDKLVIKKGKCVQTH